MKVLEYFRIAYNNLSHRKFRAYLTMIGVFIGITAVVAIISLGQGLSAAINEQFDALGTDKVFISPGTGVLSAGSTAANLTERDLKVIESVPGVRDALSFAYKSARIDYKDEQNFGLVMGVDLQRGEEIWIDSWSPYFLEGRMLEQGDNFKAYMANDYFLEDKVFDKPMKISDKFSVNGQDFEVIGFQEKVGNSADDQTVYISGDAYQRVFGERVEDDIKNIIVRVSEGSDPAVVGNRIKRMLRDERGLDVGDEDFSIQTPEELQASFNQILDVVKVVIFGIAFISLFIGGVGIMNTMFTAVVERTQEIGIMKAIGARNSDILSIFMIESGLLGLIGGIVGVAIGLGISYATEVLGALWIGTPYLQMWWSWGLIIGALMFAFLVGAVAGLFPAWKASKQKPVDSLRYE